MKRILTTLLDPLRRAVLIRRIPAVGPWAAVALAVGVTGPARSADLVSVMKSAIQSYPSVGVARQQALRAQSEKDRATAEMGPTLDLVTVRNATVDPSNAYWKPWVVGPQFGYTVYSGGALEAGEQRAMFLMRSANSRVRAASNDLAMEVAEAYLGWARAFELLRIAQEGLDMHEKALNELRLIVEKDRGRGLELDQIMVRVEAARLLVEQRQFERDSALQPLRRFGLDQAPARPSGVDLQPPACQAAAEQVQAMAMDSDTNPQVQERTLQLEAARFAVAQARAQSKPKVDVQVSRLNGSISYRPETQLMLRLTVPLNDSGRRDSTLQAAIAEQYALEDNLRDANAKVRDRVARAWIARQSAIVRTGISQSQARHGKTLAEGYRSQFLAGRRSLFDVLTVQSDHLAQLAAVVGNQYDARLSCMRLGAEIGLLGDWIQSQ